MTKISAETFKQACIGSGGVLTAIAQKLGVQRSTITKYLKRHPSMKQYVEQDRERIVDTAENLLHQALKKNKKWAIEKVLDSLGKQRGYGKTHIEHSGDTPGLSWKDFAEAYDEIKTEANNKANTKK